MKEYNCNFLVIELCVFLMERACIRGYLSIFERGRYWSHCKGACTLYCVLLIVCFFSRSLPPRHQLGQNIRNVAGAGVLFWGSMGQAPWSNSQLVGVATVPWAPSLADSRFTLWEAILEDSSG